MTTINLIIGILVGGFIWLMYVGKGGNIIIGLLICALIIMMSFIGSAITMVFIGIKENIDKIVNLLEKK